MNDRAESLVHDIIHLVQELGRRRKVFNLHRHKFESFTLEVILNKRNDISNCRVPSWKLAERLVGLIERVFCRFINECLGVCKDAAQLDELEQFSGAVGCVGASVAECLSWREGSDVDDAVQCGGRGGDARAHSGDGGAT